MCDAASATIAAVSALGSAVSYVGAQEQSNQQAAYQNRMAEERNRQMLENAESANDAAIEEYYQQNLRQQQEAEAASDEVQRVQIEKLQKMGTAIASSDGQLGALYADFQRQEANYKESVRRNFDMTTLQILQQKRTTEAKAQDRINSVTPYISQPISGPSLLGLGMGVGKAGINGYAHHRTTTEKNSPWQGVRF